MKIISMAYTAPAVIARRKTVTRRQWNDRYAKTFRAGEIVAAYDKSPRFGGKKIAEIELTHAPYKMPLSQMPDDDYEAEGFAYLHETGTAAPPSSGFRDFSMSSFETWRASGGDVWVVRFQVVSVVGEQTREAT